MLSEFLGRVRRNSLFRVKFFLQLSFVFNIAYSVFLALVGQIYSSKYFFVTSIYYALLSASRIFVFLQISAGKRLVYKIKTVRACGCFLLAINLAFSAMIFLVIYGNRYVKYHEITVITLAAYTFASMTVAIINCVKYLKKKDYLHSCAKIISLVSVSASLVTLTNVMLSTFGEDELLLRSIVLPILSVFVSVFIIVCAILMIRKANLALRNLNDEKE